jgi:hypothetical protein
MVLSFCLAGIWAFHSCEKETETIGTDESLYKMALSTSGFTWYNNSNALLNKSSGSAHVYPLLKTRYNAVAAAKLDANGKIMAGTTFQEGSLIVKELFENPTTLRRYAILYKNSKSADADTKGWVWGYINADGTVVDAASRKGASCISCHSQTGNIDYMLMNKFFP